MSINAKNGLLLNINIGAAMEGAGMNLGFRFFFSQGRQETGNVYMCVKVKVCLGDGINL